MNNHPKQIKFHYSGYSNTADWQNQTTGFGKESEDADVNEKAWEAAIVDCEISPCNYKINSISALNLHRIGERRMSAQTLRKICDDIFEILDGE
jgi:hypothetical protein